MIKRPLTLNKSPESPRDWHVHTVLRAAVKLPDKVDLSSLCGPIRDQGDAGFCHSFAGAALKNVQEHQEKRYAMNLSPLYLARRVKQIDSFAGQEGSDLLSVCKALMDTGAVQEVQDPFERYVPGSLAFPPYTGNGYAYKIKNYARCTETAEIKQALSLGKPVLLGIQCTPEIYDVDQNDPYIPLPDKLVSIGGHAVLIVGYDDTLTHDGHKGHFEIQNSWGTEWGDNGFGWIPYDYIEYRTKDYGARFLFMDAFCAVDLENDPIRETVIEMTINDNTVLVNGKPETWDQAPVIDPQSWRTLVPLRDVAELLGYGVLWDEKRKKITLVKEG